VVVITDDLARRLFGDRDPIGQQIPGGGTLGSTATTSTVIGVVRNVKYTGIDAPVEGVVYRPFAQYPWRVLFVVARTGRDPASVVADLRSVIREIDPEINIMNARSIAEVVHAAVAQPRFRTTVFSSIAVMTLLLAIVGLYGVMAYTVSQRTTEIGVRVAVGARGVDVMSLLMREAGALIVAGVVIGAAVAYALSTMLAAFLYGVTATDPSSFAIAAALVASVGTAATMLPARRATRIDPIVALRGD
jgi:putative ABC transport system permease protein